MRLYVNPISPFCRAAAVYLRERSVPFESVELTTGNDRARLLEVDPAGEVPVLETEHGVVAGSQAICDFADLATEPPSPVPPDPIARIARRRLEDIACSTTDALQFLTHLVGTRRREVARNQPGLLDRLADAIHGHYEFLDETLRGGAFLTGSYTRTDVFFFTMVSSLVFMDRPIPEGLAALGDWFARVASRPAIARDLEVAARSAAAQARSADPFFRRDRIHWRSHRIEWACRLGLASWLAEEIARGRAFFSPAPEPRSSRGSAP